MGISSGSVDPEHFGKNDYVPFVGMVEDVNDPKQSGRVKVRCIGFHPKNPIVLPTEDLPWARVGMPTTHAQIGRIGGKHGLLPGSMVTGFFMDGHNHQNPFILATFNATSRATDESNTQPPVNKDGTTSEAQIGQKVTGPLHSTDDKVYRNHHLVGEGIDGVGATADPSADNVPHNAQDPCLDGKPRQSKADEVQTQAKHNAETNPAGLKYKVPIADAKCGNNVHAAERIQILLEEKIPDPALRLVVNDVLYNASTGQKIEINAYIKVAAQAICNLLKDGLQAARGYLNETVNRSVHSKAILAATTREFSTGKVADFATRTAIDITNKLLTEFVNGLCELINTMLQELLGDGDGSGDNLSGNIGVDLVTSVLETGAFCLAETLLGNILTLFTTILADTINIEFSTALGYLDDIEDIVNDIEDGGLPLDQINNLIQGILGDSGLDLGQVGEVIDILTSFRTFKFALYPTVFNVVGILALDIFNLDGCNKEGVYDTGIGILNTLANGNGPGSGIGQPIEESNYGGLLNGSNTAIYTLEICDDALNGGDGPGGGGPCQADLLAVSLPSEDENAARNFIDGIPNSIVIRDPGCEYYTGSRGDQILYDISSLLTEP